MDIYHTRTIFYGEQTNLVTNSNESNIRHYNYFKLENRK